MWVCEHGAKLERSKFRQTTLDLPHLVPLHAASLIWLLDQKFTSATSLDTARASLLRLLAQYSQVLKLSTAQFDRVRQQEFEAKMKAALQSTASLTAPSQIPSIALKAF